jgi:hypothetical protein
MSLIEATELAAESVRGQEQRLSLSESPSLSFPNAILDIEADEEEKIKTGTTLAISDCGTYAIAAKEGLEIYPSRPESVVTSNQDQSEEEEVDTLVRFFHLDNKLDGLDGSEHELHPSETGLKTSAPMRLSWGDRVQIVSTEAGWAKLARGYGFVRADRNQLVKGMICLYICNSFPDIFSSFLCIMLRNQLDPPSIEPVNLKHCCGCCQREGKSYETNRSVWTINLYLS